MLRLPVFSRWIMCSRYVTGCAKASLRGRLGYAAASVEVVVLRQGNAIQRLRCRHWWTWSCDYQISIPLGGRLPAVPVRVPVIRLAVQVGAPCVRRRADHALLYRL